MLQINSLSFDYDEKRVFENVDISLSTGALLHLRGSNGAGKTTLLRLLAGLLRPVKGNISWLNQSIYKNLSDYQRNICYVGHKPGISPHLTVSENCLFDLQCNLKLSQLDDILSTFQLHTHADTLCSQLSMGQRRRVSLLRIAMSNASIWLLDEPLTALDTLSISLLSNFFEQHLLNNGIIILTSHQPLPSSFTQYQVYDL